jgi:glutamyl-tRNA synthetase
MWNNFEPTGLDFYELDGVDTAKFKEVCLLYKNYYNQTQDKQEWFNTIKVMADNNGYASDNKLYKQNPQDYKGNVSDICSYIRIAITGRKNSPDLYSILSLLPVEEINRRLDLVNKF